MKKSTLDILLPVITFILVAFVVWITYEVHLTSKDNTVTANETTVVEADYKLTYSPNGKFLILTDNKLLRVFEVESGKIIQEIIINGDTSLAFSPDNKSVSLIDKDKKIQTISFNDNKIIKTIEFK